jgi:hypothetical protein
MSQPLRPVKLAADPELLQSLAGMNANRDLAVVQKTRRAVYAAAEELRAERNRRRRNAGLVLLLFATLFMLLTPALWSTLEDFLNGENLLTGAGLVTMFLLMFFSVILTALFMGLRNQQQQIRQRRRRT